MALGELELDREALFSKINYRPFNEQWDFHDSDARYKIPACGRRFGKSLMAAAEMMSNPKHNIFHPRKRFWIVPPKYKTGFYEFRYLWDWLEHIGILARCRHKSDNRRTGEMYIELPWKSRIDVISATSSISKDTLVGEGLHGLIVSEAAKQEERTWLQYLRPALADFRGWAVFPSTPEGYNWYYQLHQSGLRDDDGEPVLDGDPQAESWNFPSWTNPYVYPGGFDDPEIQSQLAAAKKSGQEDIFWQEIGAMFKMVVGLIYSEWDDKVNIVDNYEFRPDWPNYRMIDFGWSNPFTCTDMQISPSDDCFIWREYYVPKRSVPEHGREISMRTNPDGYRVDGQFADPAHPEHIEFLSQFLGYIQADPECKDVQRGIQEVKRFLRDESGNTHIFVDRSCVNTVWEFQNYRTKQTVRERQNESEDPSKYADHILDPLRYTLMHLFVLGLGRYSLEDILDIEYTEDKAASRGIFTRSMSSAFSTGRDTPGMGSRRF